MEKAAAATEKSPLLRVQSPDQDDEDLEKDEPSTKPGMRDCLEFVALMTSVCFAVQRLRSRRPC